MLLVAYTIQELFAGDIARFLQEDSIIFGDILHLLHTQLSRLSALEREVMEWLVVARAPTSIT